MIFGLMPWGGEPADAPSVKIEWSAASKADYYGSRSSTGTWHSFSSDGFETDFESMTAMPDGSVQYMARKKSDGFLYHNIRYSNGTLQGWAKPNGYNGAASFSGLGPAIAGMPDGSAQVVGIGLDGRLYHRIRNNDTTWTPWAQMQGRPGESTFPARKVAIAGIGDGTAQVYAYSSDNNGLYTTTRNAAGTSWTTWSQVDPGGDGGFGPDLAVGAGANGLAMPNNSSQFLAIGTDGKVYHILRTPTGPGGAPSTADGEPSTSPPPASPSPECPTAVARPSSSTKTATSGSTSAT